MDYNNVVLMFKEFGHIIRNLTYKSNFGLLNYDNLYDNFLPYVMEYIAWDKNTIRKIVGNSDEIIDHILFSRNIDLCNSISQKCIHALLDFTIHSSNDFINTINKSLKNNTNNNQIFINLCKKIIENKTKKYSHILNTDYYISSPYFFTQMINGSEGTLYSKISNEIFAYAIYKYIINNTDNNFKTKVLQPVSTQFNILLLNYISEINVDAYNLYLNDIIGIDNTNKDNIECDVMTDNTNFFDDKDSDSIDDDNYNILQY